jgi:uncharacterized protein (DUF2235 family)
MTKNIVILADGTGQRGGITFDERRSNIYKLYRATRCGPDSAVDPSRQLAFYDPGIGTLPGGLGFFGILGRMIYNIVSQATGLGLTRNIIDCYAAIIQMWQPGDRIFLFGFSRGAYTARCVAAVVALCGVPTRMKDGSALKRDDVTVNKIAREAVKCVYQHVSSPRDTKYIPQRVALAARFRANYGSDSNGNSNTYPHFIGVFDTVAALANYGSLIISALIILGLVTAVSGIMGLIFGSFWLGFFVLGAGTIAGLAIAYLMTHIKVAVGLKGFPWWQTLHLTEARMKFYDTQLNQNVGWARHALSIDEHRADFDRVLWGSKTIARIPNEGEPDWLQQFWFAGNHSDVGGSYVENASRLSDISLAWMMEQALKIPDCLIIDQSVLKLYPLADGMQHDECRGWTFRFARKINRGIPVDATLHGSVYERFKLPGVLQYDETRPYRPENLRQHVKLRDYY